VAWFLRAIGTKHIGSGLRLPAKIDKAEFMSVIPRALSSYRTRIRVVSVLVLSDRDDGRNQPDGPNHTDQTKETLFPLLLGIDVP
jgi:hypothetical protein